MYYSAVSDSALMANSDRPAEASSEQPAAIISTDADSGDVVVDRDFGFLPIPRYLRYTGKPVAGMLLNVGFGIASTFSE
jgi:hypothetical protein